MDYILCIVHTQLRRSGHMPDEKPSYVLARFDSTFTDGLEPSSHVAAVCAACLPGLRAMSGNTDEDGTTVNVTVLKPLEL